MKWYGELIRDFVMNLAREGMPAPTEMTFPLKAYLRIKAEAGFYPDENPGTLTMQTGHGPLIIHPGCGDL